MNYCIQLLYKTCLKHLHVQYNEYHHSITHIVHVQQN